MSTPPEKLYTRAELEETIARRLGERREIVAQAVEAITPKLEEMRREIISANHIKSTLGRQLSRLTRLVEESQRTLGAHIALAHHSGTGEVLHVLRDDVNSLLELRDETGADTLTKEERAVVPAIVKGFLATKEQRVEQERQDRHRLLMVTILTSVIGALAGAITAGATVALVFYSVHH